MTESQNNNLTIEPGQFSRVILANEFDASRVSQEFKAFFASIPREDTESRLYFYTPIHAGTADSMGLFGDFAPSVVHAINNHYEAHLPFREKTLGEFGYSKLCHLYCTLDKSVMFGFFNRHMAKSKIHNLNSVAMILHRPDLVIEVEPLENKEISEEEILATLFKVKKNATKLLKEVQTDFSESQHLSESEHNFSYPKNLESLLGDNLSRVLLYGSSARGNGHDFDNIAVIKNLPENLYQKIPRSCPNENGKEVGVIFVPENVLDRFLYVNVSNAIFREHSKALKGEFNFPIESEKYKIWKEMYHAGYGSAKLISGMNLVFREPEILFDKSGLFEYFMKLNRFTLHGLLQRTDYKMPSKNEVLDSLERDFNFKVPEFRADASYLQESFLKANKTSIEIAKKMYDPSLAREENEFLLTLDEQQTKKIFLAKHNGINIYVFGGREILTAGDTVPVKILAEKDEGYNSRINEIFYRGLNKSRNFLVGRRG